MYAQELRRRLPARYFEPVGYRALWMLPYIGIAVAGVLLITLTDMSWPAKVAVALVIGLAYSCLGFLGHEILHGAVTRRGWLRDVLGGICLLPHAIAPMLWRQWHNAEHHGNTQIQGRDPDAYSTIEEYRERKALQILHKYVPIRSIRFFVILTVWLNVHAAIVLAHQLQRATWAGRAKLIVETLVPVGVWVGLAVALGWHHFPFFFVIPVMVSNFVVMLYIATNHLLNPLIEDDDPLVGSLTVTVPKFLDVIHSNFSHHTEHHIFPAMSTKYAPEIKRLLKELWPDRYNEMSLWKAMKCLWATPRLYLDNIRLIDPASGQAYPVVGYGLDPNRIAPVD
ncbi:MAG TPA: acyl-CoA desaturase [bacterium]